MPTRYKILSVRVYPHEHKAFKSACDAEGRQMSEILRDYMRWFSRLKEVSDAPFSPDGGSGGEDRDDDSSRPRNLLSERRN